MDSVEFSETNAIEAARALSDILARRTHRRKVMGQEVVVPGQLGEALRLPEIINRLQSPRAQRREAGLDAFEGLWATLSHNTRNQVLEAIGWYDPRLLDWDDPRSNRRPPVADDS
ncbi:hypothetical protein C8D92_10154 [Tamilnaduibacter salinus]|uniref:Uncharacterized protein n=1 Tax=Tamilnaduibacter salinus TaxID=1484056 RepID=A0A2U1D0Q2_9GAMM|nr:hypothetical protein [Tamilnaduibacter salinus]PVY78851.1 hypothetical protein C8D92_10154 [Tamilnaduibacter salinus]